MHGLTEHQLICPFDNVQPERYVFCSRHIIVSTLTPVKSQSNHNVVLRYLEYPQFQSQPSVVRGEQSIMIQILRRAADVCMEHAGIRDIVLFRACDGDACIGSFRIHNVHDFCSIVLFCMSSNHCFETQLLVISLP